MSRQNRISPYGAIIADPSRGLFMGNRGVLHDDRGQIKRPFSTKRWIICRLKFKGRRRTIMTPGRYTELFFLDEATALTAGHRPCFECRRYRALAFRQAWLAGNPSLGNNIVSVDTIDGQLHHERLTGEYYVKNRKKRTFERELLNLPNGAFVELGESPYLLWNEHLYPWTPAGYQKPIPKPDLSTVSVLTPPSTINALAAGYVPVIHETAEASPTL